MDWVLTTCIHFSYIFLPHQHQPCCTRWLFTAYSPYIFLKHWLLLSTWCNSSLFVNDCIKTVKTKLESEGCMIVVLTRLLRGRKVGYTIPASDLTIYMDGQAHFLAVKFCEKLYMGETRSTCWNGFSVSRECEGRFYEQTTYHSRCCTVRRWNSVQISYITCRGWKRSRTLICNCWPNPDATVYFLELEGVCVCVPISVNSCFLLVILWMISPISNRCCCWTTRRLVQSPGGLTTASVTDESKCDYIIYHRC